VGLTGAGQAPTSHTVALAWNPTSSGGVAGYNVFRASTSGGYGTNPLNPVPVSVPAYEDSSVTGGQTYFYIVTTVGAGVSSAASNEVAASIPAQWSVGKDETNIRKQREASVGSADWPLAASHSRAHPL